MPGDPTNRILIVDGHAYAYRAFYAIRQLSSPQGAPTNAIYGFIKMLAKMRATLNPAETVVVWDGGLAQERLELLPDYKAQRPSMPDDLGRQLDEIVAYLEAAGIPSLVHDGVEADDWIALLAVQAAAAGRNVVIASSDKDFMQLVTDRVGLLNPNDKSETVWTAGEVRQKTGVAPGQVVDWLSLIGDAVDNIPGVPGVGPKTATDLLLQFGTVDGIYQRLGEVKSARLKANLESAEAAVRRNQRMIRLQTDLPAPVLAASTTGRPQQDDRLAELLARWGFKTMLKELETARSGQGNLLLQVAAAVSMGAVLAQTVG